MLAGTVLPRLALVDLGVTGLGVGVIIGGLLGGTPVIIALGMMGTILAGDLMHNAASHGRQVGRRAETSRAEDGHALVSVLVGLIATGVSYGIFLTATGGQPVTAVAFLAAASVLLVPAIR